MPSELGNHWGTIVDAPTATRTPRPGAPATDGGEPGAGADAAAAAAVPRVERPGWLTTYVGVLVGMDALAMAVATLVAKRWWLGSSEVTLHIRDVGLPYSLMPLATVPTWLVILALAGAYDVGPFGAVRGLSIRIVRAGAQLLAVVAVTYYVLHLQMLGRGVLVAVIPLAVACTIAGRAVVRVVLLRARRQGRARRTALVAGSRRTIEAVVTQLADHPGAGITPIDALVVGEPPGKSEAGTNGNGNADTPALPVAEGDAPGAITGALVSSGAEAVILTGGLAKGQLRDIAWRLQGTGVELLVAPAPGELDGLRSQIRPIAGLPLLYVD
jgi:CoA-binding domain